MMDIRQLETRVAMLHLLDVECNMGRRPIDMKLELYGTGRLPAKYERALEKYFGTTDKRQMMREALRAKLIPVLCPSGALLLINRNGDKVKTL